MCFSEPLPSGQRRHVARLRLSRRGLGAALATVAVAVGVSACGSGAATAQARTACVRVNQSLRLFHQSEKATTPHDKQTLANEAQGKLLSALAPAAQATSADGSFNSLMTTIQEADRVPEKYLVQSLERQCQVIFSNEPYLAT